MRFFKRKNIGSSIIKDKDLVSKVSIIEELKIELNYIDNKILAITRDLIEARLMYIKSNLDSRKDLFNILKKNIYKNASDEAAIWHQERLRILRKEKKDIKIKLAKLSGREWLYWVKKIFKFALLSISLGFILCISFMGLMTLIYLLPFFIIIISLYIYSKRTI